MEKEKMTFRDLASAALGLLMVYGGCYVSVTMADTFLFNNEAISDDEEPLVALGLFPVVCSLLLVLELNRWQEQVRARKQILQAFGE